MSIKLKNIKFEQISKKFVLKSSFYYKKLKNKNLQEYKYIIYNIVFFVY